MPTRLADLPLDEAERLRLTPLRPADVEAVQLLTDDERITNRIDFLRSPFTRADAEALIARNGPDECFFGVFTRGEGRLIGVAGAHVRDADIEIGYWIGPAFQGRGYAGEAVRVLVAALQHEFPSRRIVAECAPENAPSRRVLEKAGFAATGAAGRRRGRRLFALAR
jgi:RimJ/RimL family protein N-acetyltransferase